jgi:dihydrofolate synthase/folylpolyglutamate synthase
LDYQQALDYINSFINYEKIGMPAATAANYNLERMSYLLERLDNPQLKYSSIVIAGTKGKGSTSAFCASALEAAGHRVALYTQPHLHTYRERMRVNGTLISKEDLAALVEKMRPAIEQTLSEAERFGRLTFYEIGTGLALLYFAEQKVDIAVLEIGLGGRLDAVNVVIPLVSVITPISYDHMNVLGNTLTEIAGEKAGIIKPGVPIVSAYQEEEARLVIERVCREKGAPLYYPDQVEWTQLIKAPTGQQRYIKAEKFLLSGFSQDFEIPLLGTHQVANAAVAAKVLEILGQQKPELAINENQLAKGLRSVKWPARLEVIKDKPGAPLLVVDGAHNAASAKVLAETLNNRYFDYRKLIYIVGTSSDKDIKGIFRELRLVKGQISAFILTRSHNARALDPQEMYQNGLLATATAGDGEFQVFLTESVPEALERAYRFADPNDLICATGSLFVTAEVREAAGLMIEKD